MKKILAIILIVASNSIYAGNPDRVGENGAYELLINGWPRSTGFWDMYTARVTGIEAMRLNPAGLAFIDKMQFGAAQSIWFQGSKTQVTQAAFGGKIGDANVLGMELMSLSVGKLYRTTASQPGAENGLGTFRPRFINVGFTFSRAFTKRIYGGVSFRFITESIENVRALGFSIDAGLQYIVGKKENLRFGVSIRNLGTPMKFSGDGLTYRGDAPDGDNYQMTISQNTKKFELPVQLTLGVSYDLWLGPEFKCNGAYNLHRLTFSGQFTSNTFGKDHFGGGVEYSFKELVMARMGYRFESGMYNPSKRTNAYTGISAGVSVDIPFKGNGPGLILDYSYRTSNPFGGTHSFGLKFDLGKGGDPCANSRKGKHQKHNREKVEVIEESNSEETTEIKKEETESKKEVVKKEKHKSKDKNKLKISTSDQEVINTVSENIQFRTGSSDLTTKSKNSLDDLYEVLLNNKKAKLNIDAYTDNVGDENDNLELSRERAFAVKSYLIDLGLNENRISAEGHGEENPIEGNETEEGRSKNRRVELTVY